MSRAQTVFVVALGGVALLIGLFAVYVTSSTMWADRWYGRRSRRLSSSLVGSGVQVAPDQR